MRIERQVRTVNRQIIFNQQPEQFVFFARPRMRRRPEQSVMHNHQIRPGGNGELHGGEAGVHRRRDARDSAGVPGLQAVDRAIVISDCVGAEQLVAVLDDGRECNFRHGGMKSEFRRRARREKSEIVAEMLGLHTPSLLTPLELLGESEAL